jgi:membrane fusion protein, heavy metal efflux system
MRGWLSLVLGCSLFVGCRAAAPPADAATRTEDINPRTGLVKLSTEQTKQVHVEMLALGPQTDVIHATGTVEFNGDRTARILPPVSGQVQNLRANVGDTVHQGDVLFEIRSRDVTAAIGDHLSSHKDLDLSEKTYAMTKDLFEHQAASRMALQQAEIDLAKNRQKVQQTEEALRVLGIDVSMVDAGDRVPSRVEVRAPIDGTVIDRTVTNGQFVGSDTAPLLTLADVSSVWVTADVFERDLRKVAVGEKADVTTTAYPDERFNAEVSRIGSTVDAQTRTAKVRFLVLNSGRRLKPGMFINAALQLAATGDALSVPTTALFVEEGHNYIYRQVQPGVFERREVSTASGGSERVRITSGLSAGDQIAANSVLLLRQLESDSAPR